MTERMAFRKLKRGDRSAADFLLEKYRPLVHKFVRRAVNPKHATLDHDDMSVIGMEALWDALLKYDMNNGASFVTYAYNRMPRYINNAIINACDAPRGILDSGGLSYKVERIRKALEARSGYSPSLDEIVDDLRAEGHQVTRDSVFACMKKIWIRSVFSEMIGFVDGKEPGTAIEDILDASTMICGSSFPMPGDDDLDKLIAPLPDTERILMRAVYIEGDGSISDAARLLGMTLPTVSYRHKKNLRRLRIYNLGVYNDREESRGGIDLI